MLRVSISTMGNSTIRNMTDGSEESSGGISRRDLLKLALTLGGVGAAAYTARRLGMKLDVSGTEPSPEVELKPSVLVLDLFDLDKAKEKYLQDNLPPGFSEAESLQAMGVEDPATREGLLKAVPQNEDQARLIMLGLLELHYKDHGRNVVEVIKSTANFLNPSEIAPSPAQASIASAVEFGKLEFDEIGNPAMHLAISPEVVEGLVAQSSESVINMSFQLGDISLTYSLYDRRLKHPEMANQGPGKRTVGETTTYHDYQENEITKDEYDAIREKRKETEVVLLEPNERDIDFVDGYAGDQTFDNLQKLAELAKKHPEKTFVVAGGNPTNLNGLRIPDIGESRLKLEQLGLWPDNLIIVGFTAYPGVGVGFAVDKEVVASYGADVYVSSEDQDNLGFQGASSYATPVITEVVRQLMSNGLNTYKKAKEGLMKITEAREYWRETEKTEYRLLNLDKAKDYLANLREGRQ